MSAADEARVRHLSDIIFDVCETPDQARRVGDALAEIITTTGKVTGETSDGYHTFNEIYDHRITLFIALCAEIHKRSPYVWRSKLHSDGTAIDGWFIMGIGIAAGEQVTYHLPMSRWDETDWLGAECPRAPEFDGHTSADVLSRVRGFYAR